MLNEEFKKQIEQEAKNFAFFNYVSAAHNGTAAFDDIETWPEHAQVCYYSIVNYMTGKEVCWPYAEPTLAMKMQAAEAKADRYKNTLLEIAGQMCDYNIDEGNIRKHSQHCRACKAKNSLLPANEALTPKTSIDE